VPLVYILQDEPVACAIRWDSEKQGVKLPGGKDGEYIYTKLCMFADDTQLFNKNDESVKKSFDILTIYEKASGSKVNYEKTEIKRFFTTCICQVSTFLNMDTIFHLIYY
jgi:hypothetical protein